MARPIQSGDIVAYADHQWTVIGRREEPGLAGKGPAVTLRLERSEKQPAPTPYGQNQKYKTVLIHRSIEEARVRLLASQAVMFE